MYRESKKKNKNTEESTIGIKVALLWCAGEAHSVEYWTLDFGLGHGLRGGEIKPCV